MKSSSAHAVIGANITRFLKKQNETQLELSAFLGVSPSTVSSWCTGEKMPRMDRIDLMAAHFGTTRAALLSEGSHIDGAIPLLGRIACGAPILAEENIEDYIPLPSGVRADYALTCRGDSMIGAGIHDGDIVYIRQDADVRNGQIAAVLVENSATLKHVIRTPDGVTLGSDNPASDPIVLNGNDAAEARIMGLAVAYLHKLI